MSVPKSQQGGKDRRQEQERRGRNPETSYLGRNTENSRRTFAGISPSTEDSRLVRGLATAQAPRRRDAFFEEDLKVPRCTSPAPLRQSQDTNTLHPNLQTHNQRGRQNLQTSFTIMKRHTSPYPTPASSPGAELTISLPKRSDTCPARMNNLQIKYTERMGRILESNLKALEPSQALRTGNMPAPETEMDEDPVPGFFVVSDSSFSSSWTYKSADSPDAEIELMDPEFISLGLLELINDLPDAIYAEYMPAPDEPMQETDKPPSTPEGNPRVALESVDGCNLETEKSVTRQHQDSTGGLLHPGTSTTNQYLNTPQKHPVSDSGIGSNMGSPCRGPFNGSTGEYLHKINVEPQSVCAEAGTTAMSENIQGNEVPNQPQLPFDLNRSFVGQLGELTPPDSAHLTPSSFFPNESSHFQQVIQANILNPMKQNPNLREFWGLCALAQVELQHRTINCLRDLEKFFLNKGNETKSSSESYQRFCDGVLRAIEDVVPHIFESDRCRDGDLPYSSGYFLDARYAAGIETESSRYSSSNTRQKKWTDVSVQPGDTQVVKQSPNRMHKRRLSNNGEILLPSAKRPMTTKIPVTLAFNAQQDGPFVKPTFQHKQAPPFKQLEIQTQVFSPAQILYHPRQQLQAFPVPSSSFRYDENTGKAIRESQTRDYRAYRDSGSETWPSTNLAFAVPSVAIVGRHSFCPPTPVSAGSGFTMSPTRPLAPETSITISTDVRQKVPTSGSKVNVKEEVDAHKCDICSKRFPRPCDLTKHKKTHERPFKCDFENCKYKTEGFPTNKERERHQNDIHTPDSKEWRCEFKPCSYKSKRESNCKQHMEKAHNYIYKRMKRNPRRRDQAVAVPTPSAKTQRRNMPLTTQQPSTPSKVSAMQGSGASAGAPQTLPIPSQQSNLFDQPFSYFEQPHILGTDLMEPNQVQVIGGQSVYQGSMSDNMSQSFYENSPVTDFEPSPMSVTSHGFDPTLAPEEWALPQSTDNFFSLFPEVSETRFCISAQQQPQQPLVVSNFPHRDIDMGDTMEWDSESHTPD